MDIYPMLGRKSHPNPRNNFLGDNLDAAMDNDNNKDKNEGDSETRKTMGMMGCHWIGGWGCVIPGSYFDGSFHGVM